MHEKPQTRRTWRKEMFCQTCVSRIVSVALVLLVALGLTGSADAALIASSSGNTNPGNLGTDATVNFAVLTNDGLAATLAGDTFGTGYSGLGGFDSKFFAGTGSGAFDVLANYLYLFQVVNNGPGSNAIRDVSVSLLVDPMYLTSHGRFTGIGFEDNLGLVSATNNFGSDAMVFSNTDPANFGVTAAGGGSIAEDLPLGYYTPFIISKGPGNFSATFFVSGLGGTSIANGGRSLLFGFTTDLSPYSANVGIIDGGSAANGTTITPVLVPEPASLAIWGLGAFGLALFGLRRRKE
jgi:hypothetical protein